MPRTIWYVSKYVSPPHGDAPGGRSWELMRELAALGNRSVVITSDANHLGVVPALDGPLLHEQRDGMDVYWLRTFKAATAKSWQRIVSWLHFEWRMLRLDTSKLPPPDVLVVSSLSLLTVISGLVLKRRHRVPLVFEVRDIWPLTIVEEGGFTAGNPLVRALGFVERLGYRRSDLVVGTMPGLGLHVAEVLGHERDVRCIPMGYAERLVDTAACPAPPPGLTAPAGSLVVGYAGTIGITNAVEVLLDAARLLADLAGIRFRIVGDGPVLGRLREEYADLRNVDFVGRVAKDQVQGELAQCDLLYLSTYPSRVWEFGQSLNKLIDYMLSARPVLASMTGLPSMIDEAGSGSFVPAGDPAAVAEEIRRYAAMPAVERERMGRAGRAWVLEHRSFRQLALDYADLLEGVAATR